MTALLYATGLLLAIVSGARSVLWMTSYASNPTDQALAAASAIGMTAAMYLLAARAALPGTAKAQARALNACTSGLFLLSIFATFDWAESGYQAQHTRADLTDTVTTEYQALLADAAALSASQQANTNALTNIGHITKSGAAAATAADTIATRRELLAELQTQQNTTTPATGTSAILLGDYRLILWLLLATLLDWSGMLCLRTAVADSATARNQSTATEITDPLLEQIRDEINQGTYGDQPAVIRVAEHHRQPPDRIRQIFQCLLAAGELTRSGTRYQRIAETGATQ
jgi:hypothetical protein